MCRNYRYLFMTVTQPIHDGIISEETWNAAQAKRKLTGHANPKRYNPEHEHILTGLLKCPVCGASMTGNFSRKHSKDKYERFYYHCKHARFLPDGRKCDYKKNWNQDDVNQAVEQIVRALICNPDFEAAMKEKIGDNLNTANLETEIKNLHTQLRKKESAKAALILQIDDLDPDDTHYARKADDLNARLNKFYYELDDIDSQIEEAEKRLASVQQQKINSDTIYKYLLYFDKYYDSFTDAEKKEFMQTFIEAIEIFEQKQDDGRFLKSITFKFPVYFNGGYVKQLGLTDKNTLETVVLLSQQKPRFTVDIDIKLDEFDRTATEAKGTYQEIRNYVYSKYKLKVSHLNIAQIKQKYGIIERQNYNQPKSENSRQPNCTPEKEKAITDALKYFKMID